MNDRYDAGYGGDQDDRYELVGYDEYGRPVYRQVAQQPPQQQSYDPYAQQQGYGYDPYAADGRQPGQYPGQQYDTGNQHPVPPSYDPYDTGRQAPVPPYDPYGQGGAPGNPGAPGTSYDPYGRAAASGQQPRVAEQTAYIPQQARPAEEPDGAAGGGRSERDYETGQFAFVEEPDGDSEDVIDWLNFTENRTERREEAKRRARSRLIALVVVLALTVVGGVGWLWYAGKLPGLSSSDDKTGTGTSVAAQNRDVIVVHLHNTKKGGTSTALLVDNTTTKQGTTVLLPNSLALTDDDGSTTTLAKSVEDDGSSGTRDAIDTVLGTQIQGTWRLDTPYLQNLVDIIGNIEVDTDADVPDPDAKKKGTAPLVNKGEAQTLSGKMAVAYATYRASGEAQNAQLERFGQVMQGVLRKMSSDADGATVTVQTLAQILDPSLTDKDLGTFLAKLADLAKGGDYKTALLPVQTDGTLSAQASGSVVKDVLGGTAKSPDKDAAVRVSVQNASGVKGNAEDARVVLLNGGFTFLEGGTAATTQAASKVLYADAADKDDATEVAKTLGLPTGAVTKGKTSSNANVSVVLGQNYEPSTP
ncbi:LytR C-terminal domain-containing protein [Streptomyces sp. S.PB5]|uniref:LytR C-terminal domain-containing protein n=1 Tax=Streptomyces sp. S.PB5 TaxID=3020844 RepID=UPI0025B056BB|nr:LytR C-terminal domain-containing protein [Streptomyces sp. S.PB5]MDN3022954.1 LytR C-terminal domain-containing protein [Streptomyces sp. S.PB5]